ncbi:MAG: hypothetical protein J6C46_01220 [Clostridia bacterium]|nr:hypothetical protein [Clostridia bacterium]
MYNRQQAEYDVGYLDIDIKEYVNQIIPMLLPLDATEEEKNKLEKILFQVTALNVYNKKNDELFNKFIQFRQTGTRPSVSSALRNIPDSEVIDLWCMLERTRPHMPFRNVALKRATNSRYNLPESYKDKNPEYKAYDARRLVKEYTKRNWSKIDLKDYIDYSEGQIQVKVAFAIRDFFHNAGSLEDINLDSKHFKEIEEAAAQLRKELIEKMQEFRHLEQFGYIPNECYFSQRKQAEKDRIYIYGCENARKFVESNKLLAYTRNATITSKQRQEKKLTDEEYKRISQQVINLFNKDFSTLPVNKAEHEASLNKIFSDISNIIQQDLGAKMTSPDQYVKLMQDTYKKYMAQLQHLTLPLRLSYIPEDKDAYASLVEEARILQQRKREVKEKNKEIYIDPQKWIAAGIAISIASLAGMISAVDGQWLLPGMEITAATASYIIHKTVEKRKLYMDVEKRYSIKNKRIFQTRGKAIHTGQENDLIHNNEEHIEREDSIENELNNQNNLPIQNETSFDETSSSTNTTSTYVRRRRSDRYKTPKDKEDNIQER